MKFLTQSTKDGNKEFVVHVKNEYDYRFESDHRQEIFEAIKYVYWKHFGTNIAVYGIPEGLKNHHTTKRDIESNNEYQPE